MVNIIMLICCLLMPPGQASQNKAASATISGRVTIGTQPAANITIALFSSRIGSRDVIAKAITDANGYYRLTNLAAGSYRLTILAPGYFTENHNGMYDTGGKPVNLDDGDTVDNIDFALQRGGVITGRITDANHQPVIEERIKIIPIDAKPQPQYEPPMPFNPRNMLTDDRGIYRIFALSPGKYKVYVGEEGNASINSGSRVRRAIYYPGTLDVRKAEIIEVTEGGEVSNIDITFGETVKTYEATGRIIDTETGKPLSGIRYDCGAVPEGWNYIYGAGTGSITNSRGEFRIEGIRPGRYAVFITHEKPEETYSEPVVFEIKDTDVSNLEVKVRRGLSISGDAVVEGAGNVNLAALLPTVVIQPIIEEGLQAGSNYTYTLAADGSFKLTGLAPGRMRIYVSSRDRLLTLLRVEQNGADITRGFTLKAGEPLTGLRLVLGYGSGIIRGEVKIENGTLPENAHLFTFVQMKGNAAISNNFRKPLDTRGRFVFDSLPSGEYEVFLVIESSTVKRLHQTVTVSSGATTQVNFVVDLQAKEPDR
jgi:hypothetical protein